MKNSWHQNGNIFAIQEVSQQIANLPVGVYILRFSERTGFFLEQVAEKFALPQKMYGISGNLVDRVLKTWDNTTSNLGVLMNGIRGTGKTVTCEVIANKINLPVIIVDSPLGGLSDFFALVQQDIVIFFDEFEKIFSEEWGKPSKLLMLMDGVMKNEHRKLFLLTTNELRIDANLIQRPGRIRYIKTFENLSPDVVMEILNDRLLNKEHIKQTAQFIAELEMITVDIVCSIIDEVNIHDEVPEKFKDVFNVKKVSELFAVYGIENAEDGTYVGERLLFDNARVHPPGMQLCNNFVGYDFYVNNVSLGDIDEVIDKDICIVREKYTDEEYEKAERDKTDLPDKPKKTYRIEPRNSFNRAFVGSSHVRTTNTTAISSLLV